MTEQGRNNRSLGSLLEQVRRMFLGILQRKTVKATTRRGFDNESRTERKAESDDRNARTIRLHEILEPHNCIDQRG